MKFKEWLETKKHIAMVITVREFKKLLPKLEDIYPKDKLEKIIEKSVYSNIDEKFLLCNPASFQHNGILSMCQNAVTFIDRISYKNIQFDDIRYYVDTRINNCYFGYGGIVVHAYAQVITFKEIKPPAEVGTHIYDEEDNKIGDWEFTENQLSIIFKNMDEINKFCIALDKTEELKGGFFKFKDIILDFTHYDQKSMEVLKGAIKIVRRNMISLMAC